jgi:TatA/E family protein of Tat protein translocase
MGSLGMPEILMILVIALIIFGPRKLPELGKTLGQSLAHFRKASEDFKRQWEDEVDLEKRRLDTGSASESSYRKKYQSEETSSGSDGADANAPVDPYNASTVESASAPTLETAPAAVAREEKEKKADWM